MSTEFELDCHSHALAKVEIERDALKARLDALLLAARAILPEQDVPCDMTCAECGCPWVALQVAIAAASPRNIDPDLQPRHAPMPEPTPPTAQELTDVEWAERAIAVYNDGHSEADFARAIVNKLVEARAAAESPVESENLKEASRQAVAQITKALA